VAASPPEVATVIDAGDASVWACWPNLNTVLPKPTSAFTIHIIFSFFVNFNDYSDIALIAPNNIKHSNN